MQYLLDLGIRIDQDGEPYSCVVDMDRLITADHEALFAFMEKKDELEVLCTEVAEYVKSGTGDTDKMTEQLTKMHPYFKMFPNEPAAYINRSIVRELLADQELTNEARQAIFEKIRVKGNLNSSENLNDWVSEYTLESLYDAVYDAALYAALVLNDSNPELDKLTFAERNTLYNLTALETEMSGKAAMLNINIRYVPVMSEQIDTFRAVLDFDNHYADTYQKLIEDAKDLMDGADILPETMRYLIDSIKDNKETLAETIYKIESLEDLIHLELYLMQTSGTRVKKCKTCGRWFAVSHDGQEYCNYRTGNKPTHYESYLEKTRVEEIRKIYQRAYKAQHEQFRRGVITNERLHEWMKATSAMKKDAIKSGKTADDFQRILRNKKESPVVS